MEHIAGLLSNPAFAVRHAAMQARDALQGKKWGIGYCGAGNWRSKRVMLEW